MPRYRKEDFPGDLYAGLTVGVMLIPQGMAYAILAGIPPVYGLYASLVPLLLYALFGTSRQLAVGPVAMVSLMITAGVSQFAEPGTEEYITLVILLALMIGIIQFSMGLLRLGFLVNFLSHPVITGFTSAAAIIIGLSQLQHLLGLTLSRTHQVHELLYHALHRLTEVNIPTFLLGFFTVILIVMLKQWKQTFPSQLIAVVAGILIVWLFDLYESGVQIVGDIPEGLPSFSVPPLKSEAIHALLPLSLAIGLVGFMESIAVAKAMAARHRNYKLDSNQELIGLGVANIGGAFFQSLPVTGGFSRTAVNEQAGAKTGLAAIISAGLIGFTLLFLTPLFYYLPNTVLAAVIVVAVSGLIDIKEIKFLWSTKREDFAMLAVTFLATLFIGVEEGIATGVVISLVMVIYQSTRPHIAVLGRLPGTDVYRNVNRFAEARQDRDKLIIRFDSMLYFANVDYFKEELQRLEGEKQAPLKLVVIDAVSMTKIDTSGVHALEDVIADYQKRHITLYLAGIIGPVRDVLYRAGITNLLGKDHFFVDVNEAIKYYNEPKERKINTAYTLQTNQP